MADLHPQFITDESGNRISVVIPIQDWETILDLLEELQDVSLYDKAKLDDSGERILLDDYVKYRAKRND